MYFQHAASGTNLVFDDPNLISASGLEPVMRLAGRAGLGRLAREHVAVTGPLGANTPLKVECLVAGMLLGADSIEDMNRLRDGALTSVIGQVRAPSTLGSFLRAFDFGNVRQLQALHRRLLAAWPVRPRCCPAPRPWRSWTPTHRSSGSTGPPGKAPGSVPPRSRLRHEAPRYIPGAAGSNSEGGFWA